MILDDRHIAYLFLVEAGLIQLWWAPRKVHSRYVNSDWSNGKQEVDQTVAAQMKALGMTHVVTRAGTGKQILELTEKGRHTLDEEREAYKLVED